MKIEATTAAYPRGLLQIVDGRFRRVEGIGRVPGACGNQSDES